MIGLRFRVLLAVAAATVLYVASDPSVGAAAMAGVALGLEIEIRLLHRDH